MIGLADERGRRNDGRVPLPARVLVVDVERILVADPNLTALPQELATLSNVSFCETMEAVRQADIVAVLVAHTPFRKIPREELMRRVVIDATGLTHQYS